MRLELTAAYQLVPEGGYVARVEEIPGVLTQGETLDEARANLADALQLMTDAPRAHSATLLAGGTVIRERISLDVADPDLSD